MHEWSGAVCFPLGGSGSRVHFPGNSLYSCSYRVHDVSHQMWEFECNRELLSQWFALITVSKHLLCVPCLPKWNCLVVFHILNYWWRPIHFYPVAFWTGWTCVCLFVCFSPLILIKSHSLELVNEKHNSRKTIKHWRGKDVSLSLIVL